MLRTLRGLGISQRWIGQQMGVSDATVSGWAHGARAPSPGQLRELRGIVRVALRHD
jgi:transcriptional regulator with XRE-family HTH domain